MARISKGAHQTYDVSRAGVLDFVNLLLYAMPKAMYSVEKEIEASVGETGTTVEGKGDE